MIRFEHVDKTYDGKRVLRDFSCELDAGITCLMAPSGAGKTTLLRLILGFEKPDAGMITGTPLRAAVLFQEDRLSESLTVRANLKLALGRAYDEGKAVEMLSALGLENALSQTVSTLSGGMKRRAALARALLFDAPVLLLDEPCQGLDERSRELALAAIASAAAGRVALVITHEAADCERLGGRMITL